MSHICLFGVAKHLRLDCCSSLVEGFLAVKLPELLNLLLLPGWKVGLLHLALANANQ